MKRTASALVLLAAVAGCVTTERAPNAGNGCGGWAGLAGGPATVPGVQGPWGQPVVRAAPSSPSPSTIERTGATMAPSAALPPSQDGAANGTGASPPMQPANGACATPSSGRASPLGLPFHRNKMPGYPAGAVAAVGALTGSSPYPFPTKRTEVRFVGPERMRVSWNGTTPDGRPAVGHIEVPGRYNFVQGALYRLKLSDIPSLPGVDLYPTLEVIPANARTEAFLAHSAVPVSFTNEDFEQVQAGNYLIKVIYLPNPQFQDLAAAGPDEIVSSRLEPGADPIAEAHRRGNILLVVRLGNIDLELTNSPPLDAPSPFGHGHAMVPGMPGSAVASDMPNLTMPGGPGVPMMGQPLPPPQMPDVPALSKNPSAGKVSDSTMLNGQPTTEVSSEDQQSMPKRRWWPIGGSDK
jgi:hypothetical protein